MRDIRVAVAQFEARDRDRDHNLERLQELSRDAAARGAEVVSFHECCIPGYTHLMGLEREELAALAEPVAGGPSSGALREIARELGIVVAAGLLERDGERIFNTYVVVTADGRLEKFRKIHPFVNPHISAGSEFKVFDLLGCRWGILICYDNNLPENVRITRLMGAEIIFMPHVTCGLPSAMPGRGKIDRRIWEERERDPARCRQQFLGPKGRGWLMRWLPCRAYENGIYALFTNAVGVDHDTIKSGGAMILDPYGEVIAESHALGDDVTVGLLTAGKLTTASGTRYIRARRPDLYGRLVEPPPPGEEPVTLPGWKLERPE